MSPQAKKANDPKLNYRQRARDTEPKRPLARNLLVAFIVGGAICTVGQGVSNYLLAHGYTPKTVAEPLSIIMVFLGSLFTAFGIYDRLGKLAGMGSALPVTGFANSITSAAMEGRREGLVLGVGAKLFVIAGPVIVYGASTAFLVGIVVWATSVLHLGP